MSILQKTNHAFNEEISKIAEKSLTERLKKQGINRNDLNPVEFQELLTAEANILKSDAKKVGSGFLIGVAISLLTGF